MAKKIKQLIKSTLFNRKGFTLIELIAVIILLMIAFAIGAMSLFNWLHHSEFIKNEEYARQTYLTAQTALVNMKSDGGIENLVEEIVALDVDGRDRAVTTLVGASDKVNYEEDFNDTTFKGSGGNSIPRIYALIGTAEDYKAYQNKYNGTHYTNSSGGAPVLRADAEVLYDLIDPYIYDKSMLYNTICVEIDVEEGAKYSKNTALTWAINDRVVLSSAHIHSVFFSTMASDFTYDREYVEGKDIHEVISLNAKGNPDDSRDPDFRESLMLGYYSVDDRGNVADIASQKLKMKDARIVNDETLDLDFSSTSSGDVEYSINLYSDGMDDRTVPIMTAKFTSDGLMVNNGFAKLSGTLYRSDGSKLTDFTDWKFPYTYDGYEHKITLDAMMDAAAYSSSSLDDAENFSITRLLSNGRTVSDSSTNEIRTLLVSDIHADVTASKTTASATDAASSSNTVETNSANPMFQTTAVNLAGTLINSCEAGVTKFRHLSNIRFLDNANEDLALGDSEVVFTLKNAIDWTDQTVPTVMYDAAGTKLDVLKSFPMIPEFQKKWTFSTNDTSLNAVAIKNLYIDEDSKITSASVFKNTSTEGDDYIYTLGLFGVNKGNISALLIKSGRTILNAENPTPLIAGANDADKLDYVSNVDYSAFEPDTSASDTSIRAAGIVCGINRGLMQNVKITNDETDSLNRGSAIVATLQYNSAGTGVGQVCGINETPISDISTNSITKASTQGVVKANISGASAGSTASAINAGIGGVTGYMSVNDSDNTYIGSNNVVQNTTKEKESISILNNADVTGNMYVGGVVGNIEVSGVSINHNVKPTNSHIRNVVNKGLVLSSTEDGKYIGGIAGYSNGAIIASCDSSPGYNNSTILSEEVREKCNGDYVGGIVGYSNSGEIYDCTTVIDQGGNGYVFGRDNVGGIVGGTGAAGYIQGEKDDNNNLISETENGCAVFGRNNVGGIIGENTQGISFCVNTGLVGGFGKNVGGIAGSNVNADIKYCTTKIVNDTDNSKYTILKDTWKSEANNVGGIVGYNKNGTIIYDNTADNTIGNKMNAYVVAVGKNNVGGIIGLNESGTVKLKLKNETSTSDDGEDVTPSAMDSLSGVISGKVYGSGDCVGGIVGLNLSSTLFSQENTNGTFTDSGLDNLSSHMYWIEGRNAVGGIIGANMISTSKNVKMSMHADNENENASVKGRSLVGGLIGYNRILTNSLSATDNVQSNLIYVSGSGTGTATSAYVTKQANNTFVDNTSSCSTSATGRLIIEGLDSNEGYANRTKVSGSSYVSGIVGKNDATTNLVIRNCINKGDITGIAPVAADGEVNVDSEIKIGSLLTGLDPTEDIYNKTTVLVGGIVGENTVNSVVDNCVNEANIFVEEDVDANGGMAGVAGINRGLIFRCQLGSNIGDIENDYIGGIVSINYNANTGDSAGSDYTYAYTDTDSSGNTVTKNLIYTLGTVENCKSEPHGDNAQVIINGNDCIGGIVSVNYKNASVKACGIKAKINAETGNNIGGIVGLNYGDITVGSSVDDYTVDNRTVGSVTISGLDNVGGVVGFNTTDGNVIAVKDEDSNDVDATTNDVVISGNMYVGGIVGFNEGGFESYDYGTDAVPRFINKAVVNASNGYAGGIIGMQQGVNSIISNADNYGNVTSTLLYAGGITAMNAGTVKNEDEYPTIDNCANYGNVKADNSFAGAIAAVNRLGKITNCIVSTDVDNTGSTDTTIYSRVSSSDDDGSYAGIITAKNSGIISDCDIEEPENGDVIIDTSALYIGGITGCNTDEGIIRDDEVNYLKFNTDVMEAAGTTDRYTVGGISGTNEGIIYKSSVNTDLRGNTTGSEEVKSTNLATVGTGSTLTISASEKGFSTVNKLGGIAGINSGAVKECKYSGKMVVVKSEIDNAYGGIAGENVGYDDSDFAYDENGNIVDGSSLELVVTSDDGDKSVLELAKGSVEDCDVEKIQLSAPGIVSFSAGTTYDQKARMGAAVGGIVGNNGEGAFIRNSFIDRNVDALNNNADALDPSKITSYIIANEGLVGGVAGSNIGTIEDSGAVSYKMLTNGYTTEDGEDIAPTLVHSYTETSDDNTPRNDESDDFFKDDFVNLKAAAGHGTVLVSARRNTTYIGGITGYNGGEGSITGSVTGSDWHVYFESTSNDPGVAGIMGWSESGNDTVNTINMATTVYKSGSYVGIAGGIVGRMWSNSRYVFSNCYNFGKICGLSNTSATNNNTRYGGRRIGGIMGENKFEGGDINDCHNYGTVVGEYINAGIVSCVHGMNTNSPIVVQGCTNHGKIYYRRNVYNEDNRGSVYTTSAGIVAGLTNGSGKINIASCANYGDVVRVDANENEQPWEPADRNASAGIFGRKITSGTVTIQNCRNFGRTYWSIVGKTVDSSGNMVSATNTAVNVKRCVSIAPDAGPIARESEADLVSRYPFGVGSTTVNGNIFIYSDSDKTDVTIDALADSGDLTGSGASDNFNLQGSLFDNSPVLYASKYSGGSDYMYYAMYPHADYQFDGITADGENTSDEKSSLINMLNGSIGGSSNSVPIISALNGKTVYGTIGENEDYNLLFNIYGKGNDVDGYSEGNYTVGLNILNSTYSPEELFASKTTAEKFALAYFQSLSGGGWIDVDNTSSDGTDSDSSSSSDAVTVKVGGGRGGSSGSSSSSTTKLTTPYGGNKAGTAISSACSGGYASVYWNKSSMVSDAYRYEVEYYAFDTEADAKAAISKGTVSSYYTVATSDVKDERDEPFAVEYFYGSNGEISANNCAKANVTDSSVVGKWYVARVRACVGMYESDRDSDWAYTGAVLIKNTLPTPNVRLQYFDQNDGYDDAHTGTYVVVQNAQDYAECLESDPTIQFKITFAGTQVLTQDNFKNIGDATEVKGFYHLSASGLSANRIALATVTKTGSFVTSAENTVMYDFYSKIADIRNNFKAAITSCSFTGTSVDSMKLEYTIVGKADNRMPQYRVELVKETDVDGKTVSTVVQAQSVSLTTNSATYSMNNFPADLFEGNPTFKLRMWLEKSGKGEVVFYHEIDANDTNHKDADGNYLGIENGVIEYENDATLGDYAGRKYYSPVINGNTAATKLNTATAYLEYQLPALSLLEYPVLREGVKTDDMEKLMPVISVDGTMYYNFDWDVDENNAPVYADASYKAEFTGIRKVTQNDGTVSEITDSLGTKTVSSAEAVAVVNADGGTDSRYNIVQLNANGWNYDQVRVRVVRTGSDGSIGLASEKTYDVYRRLQTLNAPRVSLDTDSSAGLNYNISWNAKDSYDVCAGYKVLMTYTDKDGNAGNDGKPVELTDLTASVENQTSYTCSVNLEEYTGCTASIYVVAYPYMVGDTPRDMYQQSQNGNMSTIKVAERAEKPEVNFTAGWTAIQEDGSDAVTEDEFDEGAVEIKAAIKAIGNDELYNANLQGVVFESMDAAKAWIDKLNAAENDTERIKLVEQLMALNNIEGTEDTAGELVFGILNMNNDTASSKNDTTRDWLYYTQSLTKSSDGIGYQNAGHYVIPLVRRITNASAAAYSVWSWDARDSYAGVLKLPRIKLNTPSPTVVSESMSNNGIAVGYKSVDDDGNLVDTVELTNVSVPLRYHTWEPSATIKPDAYDLSVLTDSLVQLNYRLEYSDGQVVIQPYTITTDEDGNEVVTYDTAMPVSKVFTDKDATTVFGSTAVLSMDTNGVLDEDNVRHYTDIVTVVPKTDDETESAEPVEILRREYTNKIDENTEFTYTYTVPDAEVSFTGTYVYGGETFNYKITQSPQLILKANAEGITQYSVLHAGVDYTSDMTPITFNVADDAETTISIRDSIDRNYREIYLKAVIKDPLNPQYVSSETAVSKIWQD